MYDKLLIALVLGALAGPALGWQLSAIVTVKVTVVRPARIPVAPTGAEHAAPPSRAEAPAAVFAVGGADTRTVLAEGGPTPRIVVGPPPATLTASTTPASGHSR
jgi:hypothetical protein